MNTFAETKHENLNYKIFRENIKMKVNNFSLLVFANSLIPPLVVCQACPLLLFFDFSLAGDCHPIHVAQN